MTDSTPTPPAPAEAPALVSPPAQAPVSPPVPPAEAPAVAAVPTEISTQPAWQDEVVVSLSAPIMVARDKALARGNRRTRRAGDPANTYLCDELHVRKPTMGMLMELQKGIEAMAFSMQMESEIKAATQINLIRSCTFTSQGDKLSVEEMMELPCDAMADLEQAFRDVGGEHQINLYREKQEQSADA